MIVLFLIAMKKWNRHIPFLCSVKDWLSLVLRNRNSNRLKNKNCIKKQQQKTKNNKKKPVASLQI